MKIKVKIPTPKLIKNFLLFSIIQTGILLLLIFINLSCVSTSSRELSDKSLSAIDKSLPALIEFKELDLEEPEDPLLKILWQYDPDSYYLIYLAEQIPYTITVNGIEIDTTMGSILHDDGVMRPIEVIDSRFHAWIISQDHLGQLHDMIRAIHEISHGFTHNYSYVQLSAQNMNPDKYLIYWFYFIDRQKAVAVKTIDLPPVSIIIDVVPPLLKKGGYEVYIEHKAAYNGVFSLLDEFSAYYHNTRFASKLFNYFRDKLTQNFETWNEYRDMMFWWSENYFDFRYFILTYMMVLREVDPESYNGLMGNKAFRLAFTEIDDRFSEIVTQLEHIFQVAIPDIFNKLGYATKIYEKSYTYTWHLQNGSEITQELNGLFLDVTIPEANHTESWLLSQPLAVQLKQEMAQPEYLDMAALLRIDSE